MPDPFRISQDTVDCPVTTAGLPPGEELCRRVLDEIRTEPEGCDGNKTAARSATAVAFADSTVEAGKRGAQAANTDGALSFGDEGDLARLYGVSVSKLRNETRAATSAASFDQSWLPADRPTLTSISSLVNRSEIRPEKMSAGDRAPDTIEQKAPEHLDAERQRLMDRVTDQIANPQERERFLRDMQAFEQRAQKDGLNAREVARTYEQITRLMEATVNAPLGRSDRARIAEGIMHNAAHPGTIEHGFHHTGNVSALEQQMYRQNPARAAEMVAATAVNGYFTALDGRQIAIEEGSLRPDAESRHGSVDGQRNHASQIFQVAAINNYWQRQSPPLFYSQERPADRRDTGERLRDAGGMEVARRPNLTAQRLMELGKSLGTGNAFLIINADDGGSRRQ